jgi:hypothetical protein
LAGTLGETTFLAKNREWPGLADWFDQLAVQIPRGAIVYSDAPGFGAPLRFLYGIASYEVHVMNPGERMDPMTMMRRAAEEQTVFWLTQNAIPEAYAAHAQLKAALPLSSVILGTTTHTVPRYLRPRGGIFTLYRIMPLAAPPAHNANGTNP